MVIAAIAALVVSSWGFAQGVPNPRPGASTPVQVVNGPSNPVPVTGTIGLTGNANVTVTNAPSNPLPVVTLNANDSALNAFQKRVLFGAGNPAADMQFTIPAGKRLVIQSIAAEVTIATGQRPEVFLALVFDGKTTTLYVPLTFAATDSGEGKDYYQGLHATRFFADGGTTVLVSASPIAFSPVNSVLIDMTVSGYLVDMP